MRLLSIVATLALLFPHSALADCVGDCACETCVTPADELRAWEIARLEQRLYRRVEYPSRMRTLNNEIEFTEARIDALERLLIDYGRVTRFRTGNALTVTSNNARFALMREEAHLRDLREQRVLEQRYHRQMKRLHATRVAEATQRAALAQRGEPTITIVNH